MTLSNENSSPQEKTKPRRRWFQFSLRTFLVLITAICLLLGFWIVPSERQRSACENLRIISGSYSFETGPYALYANYSDDLAHQAWYQHYFYRVKEIRYAGLLKIDWAGFSSCECADLSNSVNRNKVFNHLNMEDIQEIDEQLISLAGAAQRLKKLDISDREIGRRGIEAIGSLTELEQLNLCRVNLASANLEPLAKLKKLKVLNIADTVVSNKQLEIIRSLPNLEYVGLTISSRPLARIRIAAECKKLKALYLNGQIVKCSILANQTRDTIQKYTIENEFNGLTLDLERIGRENESLTRRKIMGMYFDE